MNIRDRFVTAGEIDKEKEPDEFDKLVDEHIELFMKKEHDGWTSCKCEMAKQIRAHCNMKEPST